MRLSSTLLCIGLLFAGFANAQERSEATLLLHPDLDCVVRLDGKVVARLKSGDSQPTAVTLGEHLVEADSQEGGYHWEKILDVKDARQMVLPIPLWAITDAKKKDAIATQT